MKKNILTVFVMIVSLAGCTVNSSLVQSRESLSDSSYKIEKEVINEHHSPDSKSISAPAYRYTYTDEHHKNNKAGVNYINKMSTDDLTILCVDAVAQVLEIQESGNESSTLLVYIEKAMHLQNEDEYEKLVKAVHKYAKSDQYPNVILTKSAIDVFTGECVREPFKTVGEIAQLTFEEAAKKPYKLFYQNFSPVKLNENCREFYEEYLNLPDTKGRPYVWIAIVDKAMQSVSPSRYDEYEKLRKSHNNKTLSDDVYFMAASDKFRQICNDNSTIIRDAAKAALKEALDPFYRQ